MTAQFEAAGSSRFYLSEDGAILGKVCTDKYSRHQQPVKWLLHDYLEKRWLLQTDAAKEYRSLRVLQRAGLRTPAVLAGACRCSRAMSAAPCC
ncbi:hypothetical protein MBH78_08150 [Oceanimonas sp. NS1]|nr:hypothetical protein [Oceanimonas sp. NS1]